MTQADGSDSITDASSLRPAAGGFGLAAVIVVAARCLAGSAADLTDKPGISTGFVRVDMLPNVTSLPEAAVTFAVVRSSSYGLAVGNLPGSNEFNPVRPIPLDLADGGGSLLARTRPSVLAGAMFAILPLGQTIIEPQNTAECRVRSLEPDAVVRMLTSVAGLYLAYQAQP